ncbi:hypothetical protein EBX93_18785, partial [bacterium]|nr:hypothetical protein [bacterium]
VADTLTVTEGATAATVASIVSGNVKTNDTIGDGTAAENTITWGSETAQYGTLVKVLDGNGAFTGAYTYQLNNALASVQQLTASETLTETFTYTLRDKDGETSTQTLRITIQGTNDTPVARADEGTVPEGASTSSVTSVSGDLRANDSLGDGTLAQNVFTWGTETALYGTLTRNDDGTYSYAVNNTLEAVQRLTATESLTETFSYSITDKDGQISTANLVITLQGTNDVPVLVADINSVAEDSTAAITGSVRTNDAIGDGTAAENVLTWGSEVAQYGSITRNADGSYSYTLDNTKLAVQQLAPTDTLTETFSYSLRDKDGSVATSTLTITINGTDDLPTAVADARTVAEDA